MLEQELDAWVYTADEWLIRKLDAPHVAREAWTVKFDARVVTSFTDEHLASAVKIVGVSDDLKLVAACEAKAQKALGKMASAARSQPYYLDVTHPQANKGAVVGTLLTATHNHRTADYRRPTLLLMGTEQSGLTPELAAVCDTNVKIPMRGRADSLNLSVATGIMIYAAQGL